LEDYCRVGDRNISISVSLKYLCLTGYSIDAWIGIVSGWGYISQNGRKVSPTEAAGGECYGFPYGKRDCLAVLVDFNSDSIFFFKNQRCQGMAYKFSR
jgi:hypothetical protein